MKQRIITAIVLAIIAIPVCIFSGSVLFPILWAFLGVVGVWELLGCMGTRNRLAISIPLYILAVASPLAVWRGYNSFIVNFQPNYSAILLPLLLVLYILAVWVFSYQKDQEVDMNRIIASALVSLYIIGACSSVVMVREARGGEYYWYFVFIGAWVTDIFAYFTGMLFGKHKLIPAVSPKKTVEGAIGGTVFCVIFFVGFGTLLNRFTQYEVSLLMLAAAGLISAFVSMIGDLSMSVIKRTYGIKDYGKLFPGHGGVLDRFDSILAVAIVLALFLA
ncbi:MAG: phosphatidate cytidylyltransferase [Clostridia bacterium]|nr:phosphatidate cytidylyltransferase [Clostridia bacterium]